jgi:hypothetical protein
MRVSVERIISAGKNQRWALQRGGLQEFRQLCDPASDTFTLRALQVAGLLGMSNVSRSKVSQQRHAT